jgi:trigger factor
LDKSILDDHQAQVVVEVDADRVQAARQRAARKLATRGKIPGFRPGKAPYDVIVRYYGDAAVYEQAIDLLVDEVYPEMLKEAGIEPAAAGSLEKIEGDETPKLTFRVPLSPEVTLGDYRAIRTPYEFVAPDPGRLDEALNELRQVYATTETVERPAAEGDHVIVDIQSDHKELERSEMPVMLRSGEHADEFPFAGFSSQLAGLKAGETKSFQHQFSEDAALTSPAGKAAELNITVKTVRNVTLPALDDDFARLVGKYESIDALKEALKKEIEARARSEYDDKYYAEIVDQLREGAQIKYAPQTLDHEAEHVVNDMRRRLAQQGLDLETYYKMRSTDSAKFIEEEAKPVARKRLERSLILDEVARVEKIDVDNEALDEEFNSTLLDLQGQGVNLGAIRGGRQGQQKVAEAVAVQSASRLLTRRTLERLREIATGGHTPAAEDGKSPAASTAKSPSRKAASKAGKKPWVSRPHKTAKRKSSKN